MTSKVAIRELASEASKLTSPVEALMTPAKSARMSITGTSGVGSPIRSEPMIAITTGSGKVNTTPTLTVTNETGRPHPSFSIGPTTTWPTRAG